MSEQENLGLFLVSYEIGTGLPGAPNLTITMTVRTSAEYQNVNGTSVVTQAVNPPVNITSDFKGDYTYMTVMPNNSHILVKAKGYPHIDWPPHGGIGPVLLQNLDMTLVLESDWQSGTANYRYRNGGLTNDDWVSVADVPVKKISSEQLEAA